MEERSGRDGSKGFCNTFKEELEVWNSINRQLKHHGLKTVAVVDPKEVLHRDDVIGLSQPDSESLRDNLTVLMKDGDRRQSLIQDLIITNNQLRSDLETRAPVNTESQLLIAELRNQLSIANNRVAELEVYHEHRQELAADRSEKDSNSMLAAKTRIRQLETRCELQDAEVERLRLKISQLNEDQQKKEKRVQEIFTDLRKNVGKGLSSSDKRLVDVIDMYESELSKVKRKLRALQNENNNLSPADEEMKENDEPNRYKDLIKSLNTDMRKLEKDVKKLREKNEILELELQARPQVDDYNKSKQKIRQLERLLQEHSIGIYGKDAFNKGSYSTRKEDIELLPLPHCRKYLTLLCEKIELSDLDDLSKRLDSYKDSLDAFPHMESLITQIADTVEPSLLKGAEKHRIWCSKHWKSIIKKLETWRQQTRLIPELIHVVSKLLSQFGKPMETLTSSSGMLQIIEALEKITADVPPAASQPAANESASPAVLSGIVKHFQHLFDVPTISGVFPRMNELYTRYAEMKNVLKSLAELLDLGPNYKGSDVVDAVGRVCKSYTSSTYAQLKQLLQEDELDSVIERLDQHRKFMPLFKGVVNDLMVILDVQRLDQIVPSVRALKLMIS